MGYGLDALEELEKAVGDGMFGVEHNHFDGAEFLLVNQPVFFKVGYDDADGRWRDTGGAGQVAEAEGLAGMFQQKLKNLRMGLRSKKVGQLQPISDTQTDL